MKPPDPPPSAETHHATPRRHITHRQSPSRKKQNPPLPSIMVPPPHSLLQYHNQPQSLHHWTNRPFETPIVSSSPRPDKPSQDLTRQAQHSPARRPLPEHLQKRVETTTNREQHPRPYDKAYQLQDAHTVRIRETNHRLQLHHPSCAVGWRSYLTPNPRFCCLLRPCGVSSHDAHSPIWCVWTMPCARNTVRTSSCSAASSVHTTPLASRWDPSILCWGLR